MPSFVNASVSSVAPPTRLPWHPSREDALRRLGDFVPRAGRAYAAQRNYDRGPAERDNVSLLSPYLRHRIVTEAEVLTAVLSRHSLDAAEKFVAEVFWRTYWKGWLQTHPVAWERYWSTLTDALTGLAANAERAQAYADAVAGRTGIDAFDAWIAELVATNYLHNHARMWFASIWIFTLGLPWELGADLFMRHLLDGDPASNTLSWRWVAGLQTRGKTYAATRENIRRYTEGRFAVQADLARATRALVDEPVPDVAAPIATGLGESAGPALLLLHDDDLAGDAGELPAPIAGVCAVTVAADRSPLGVADAVADFSSALARGAVSGLARQTGGADLGLIYGGDPESIGRAIAAAGAACGAVRVVTPFAPVGPVQALIAALRPTLLACDLPLEPYLRRYDAVAWPLATRGFFKLRAGIPKILGELGISG